MSTDDRIAALEKRVVNLELMLPNDQPEPGSIHEALKYCTTRLKAENKSIISEEEWAAVDERSNNVTLKQKQYREKNLNNVRARRDRWKLLISLIAAEMQRAKS